MSGAWRPLLDGDEARRARVVIDRVARALADGTRDGSSLEAGQAGIALMMAALAREGDEEAADRAVAAAERAADALPEAPWLLSGMAGIAWVIEHVRDLIEPDEEGLEEIDRALARLVALPTWPFEVELRAGLAGIAVYALARAGRADADRVLVGALDHLERLAVRRGDGAVWLSPPDAGDLDPEEKLANPDGYLNLGMAHGLCGVVALLAELVASGAGDPARARALLAPAVRALLDQDAGGAGPRYALLGGERLVPRPPLSGWCAGDLAAAAALIRAGQAAGEPRWIEHGRELARHSAASGPDQLDARLAGDPTFCHGASGRGHVLNRIAQATGDRELEQAARAWLVRALAMAEERGPAPPGRGGLRDGAAGTALALLAGCTDREPAWDRPLLVALPPAGSGGGASGAPRP